MSKIARSLIFAGGLVTLANVGTCTYNNATNVDGDGYMPANSLTSFILGVERSTECYRSPPYNDWRCEPARAYVLKEVEGGTLFDGSEPRCKIATFMGPGIEFLLGLGLFGLGAYLPNRRKTP